MNKYSLSHLTDGALLRDLAAIVARDRATTADLLAHIAEVDARKLYLPAAYPSMLIYCVHELQMSEDAARKRIHAARAAHRFPVIFSAVAEGRLHLSGVVMLAPRLTEENAGELLAAAEHKTKPEIEQLLASRFPMPDLATRLEPIGSPLPIEQLAARPVDVESEAAGQRAPGRVDVADQRPKLAPLAPGRFAFQVTIGQSTHDKLRYAQELLSHQVRFNDVAEVLDRALDALIVQREKRKFGAASRWRPEQRRSTKEGRYIPADIRCAVWKRDGGQCTYVSDTGKRCSSRTLLEFDHIDEVARGGQASVDRIRLRCRPHNQFTAEQAFGAEFMKHKREEARRAGDAKAQARQAAEAKAQAQAQAKQVAERAAQEVIPWLRQLGFRADEARRAAAACENPEAPLEERVRVALASLAPHRGVRRAANEIETAA